MLFSYREHFIIWFLKVLRKIEFAMLVVYMGGGTPAVP